VLVLSEGLWRSAFGADSAIVGKSIPLDGRPHTVIGVMPGSFDPTQSGEGAWKPAGYTAEQLALHDEHGLTIVGRLRPGVTMASAQRELDGIAKQMEIEYPLTNKTSGVALRGHADTIIGNFRDRLLLLLSAVVCVLLIACVNVANLLLARGSARSKELAIRTAIGAGRSRIIRQLLTESLVLAVVSAAVGLALAWAGVHMLLASAPGGIPRLAETRIDGLVLAFTLGLALMSSLIFGLVPAMRLAGGSLQAALREGGRTAIASARDKTRATLVAMEVAIALTLLIGAGLLIRSAINLNRVDPGFDPKGVLTARIALRASPPGTTDDAAALETEQTFTRMYQELRARPGVGAAAIVSQVPAGPGGGSNGLIPEGKAASIENAIDAQRRVVTPGYLSVMGIKLLAGRDINEQDIRGGVRVVVVSASLAKAAWGDENPIGKRISCCEGTPDDPRYKTVVGVAADVRSFGPAAPIRNEFYVPMTQIPPIAWRWNNRAMTLVARAKTGDAGSMTPVIRSAVAAVDPQLPVFNVFSMEDRLRLTIAQSRFHLILLSTLGVVGMLLAAAGIYSVIAYFVTLRTHEIGVRMALGANSGDVIRLLTFQGLRPVILGALLGTVGSAWATRLLSGSLFGVGATDPTTFAAVTALLLAVAVVAILIPARRATSVDPTMALHG
jgi:putative ABC transport system permease protein